jgi:hypothetical protein
MKRFIFYLLLMVVITLTGGAALWSIPYVLYFRALYGSLDNGYITIAEHSDSLITGGRFILPEGSRGANNSPYWWHETHLRNFIVPLPMSHPLLIPIPLLKNARSRRGVLFGAKISTTRGDERLNFYAFKPFRLHLEVPEVKLWTLPLPKKMLSEHKTSKIWKDLFFSDLSFGINRHSTFYDYLDRITSVKLGELNYRLYLLYLRIRLWGDEQVKTVSFYSDKEEKGHIVGVVELERDDATQKNYLFLTREGGIIRGLRVAMLANNATAADVLQLLISKHRYKQSQASYTDVIYQQYRQIPYTERIDHPGMVYLYSCWSHQMENEAIMQEMITFLERGEDSNRVYLDPLYRYAHYRFGSSLSGKGENLKESAARRLERKIQEEGEAQIAYERSLLDDSAEDFESDKDKVDFFLRRAKDRKQDADSSNAEIRSY